MAKMPKCVFVCVAFTLLAACAHPTDKSIASFADSTTKITQSLKSAADLDRELDSKINLTRAAINYAGGDKFGFPPRPGKLMQGDAEAAWIVYNQVMSSISAYATALSTSNDPNLGKSLVEQTKSLSLSFAKFEALRADEGQDAAVAAARLQRTELTGAVIGDLLGYAIELYSGAQIREVMHRVHPTLQEAVGLLTAGFNELRYSTSTKAIEYAIVLNKKIRLYRTDVTYKPADRFKIYTDAAEEVAQAQGRLAAFDEGIRGLQKMIKAHAALLGSIDDKRAVSEFAAIVSAVAEKLTKLRELEKTV